jgi:hypothetical protein
MGSTVVAFHGNKWLVMVVRVMMVLPMEHGGMMVVGADATGGGGTRVFMRHISTGTPPPLVSLNEAL